MRIEIQHYAKTIITNLEDDVTLDELMQEISLMLAGIGYHHESIEEYIQPN